jgi:hypothetical protein
MEGLVESVRFPNGIRVALAGAGAQARRGASARAHVPRPDPARTRYGVGGVQRNRPFGEGSCWGDEVVDRATNGEAA